jgi:hypothetical protein
MANPELNGRDVFWPGALAGIVGGAAMGLFSMILSAHAGMGFFAPLKMMSATVFGSSAMTMGGSAIIVGLMIHMTMAAVSGIGLAALLPRETSGAVAAAVGGAFGLCIFLVMAFIGLRIVNHFMFEHINRRMFLMAHLIYGVSLSLIVPIRHALGERSLLDTAHTEAH